MNEGILNGDIAKALKIPKWIMDMFPEDLKKVFCHAYSALRNEPSTSGRRSAIDEDNIKDVVYYLLKKKGIFQGDPFSSTIKDSTLTPLGYAKQHKKYKSISFICCARFTNDFLNPFVDESTLDAPIWYQYLFAYISKNKSPKNKKWKINKNQIYQLILNAPEPIDCINFFIPNYKEILLKSENLNEEQSNEFYQRLTEKQKDDLIHLIRNKDVAFNIDNCVLNDGIMHRISNYFGIKKVFEYTVETGKINDFKKYIGCNLKRFENFKNCFLIMPQFKGIYEIAFEKVKIKHVLYPDEDPDIKIINHMKILAKNGYCEEFKFMMSKGISDLYIDVKYAMILSFSKPMIEILEDPRNVVGKLLADKKFDDVLRAKQLGYPPDPRFLGYLYDERPLSQECRNFSIIEKFLLPSDPLDDLKFHMADHSLIVPFLKKYGSRLKDKSPDSWKVFYVRYYDDYIKSCNDLMVDPQIYAQQFFKHIFFTQYCHNKYDSKAALIKIFKNFKIDLGNDDAYLLYAIRKNDIKIAVELLKLDGNLPDNWSKDASYEMIRVITANI